MTEKITSGEALLKAREELETRVAERTDELKRANAALETEIKELKKAEGVLHSILEGTSSVLGEEFLRSLARNLASTLNFRYALVGELADEGRSVRTLALWANGSFAPDLEYPLKDTPCEQVVGKEACVYPKGVARLFPKDRLLTDMGVESYIGVPLFDAGKKPIGILVGLDDRPMEEKTARAVLSVFAQRASLEMARKKAEDERKKSADMLNAIIDNATAVIFMKDPEGRFMVMNRWYERNFGVKMEDLIGKTDHDLFPKEIADRLRENDRKVVEGGVPVSLEEEVVEPDGLMHTYITVKFPIPGYKGAICGIATDITGRKRTEEKLKKSTERLKEAQQIARIGNWDWDIANNTLFWSDEIYRIFGLKPNEFGATYEAFLKSVHPEDRESVMNAVNDAHQSGAPYSIDHRVVLPDGSVRIVHEDGRVILSDDGAPVRMAGTVQDITGQRLAEEKLRESEKKFRNLTENIPIGISITAEDGTILEANPALWKIFGCDSREEFQRHKIQDFYVDPAERKRFIVTVKERGMVKDMEVRVKRKDRTEFPGALTALAQSKGGGEMQIISIFQDITERKKTEAELLKAQKLESIGALAGGIAHDFNNILLGVLGNVTIAKNYLPEGERVYSLLTEVEKAADRAKNLTRQLLTFSRGGEPVKEVAPIAALVKDSAALVLRESGTGSSFDIPSDLWMVEMDEGQMSQVMNNIVLNAEQAMDGKGVIEISVKNIAVTPDEGLPAAGGDYVRITVEDSGHGIPERLLNRIFDPFFTTRQKASGLGLAVSYSIVKKHNGFIQVSSVEGKGSVFQVYLPAVRKTAESARETGKTVAAKAAGMVLVMDDEEIVRDVSGEMLNILGCKAVFAKDGEEAVELYRKALKEGRPFAAVILDLTIPGGMGGVETVRRLLDIDPDVKAIVSSGYSKDPIMSDFRKYGFSGVIAKPYRVSDFSRAVKGVLEGECTA